MLKNFLLVIIFFLYSSAVSQEQNITPYLKMIEAGELGKAHEGLASLKKSNPDDASVKFLNAVLLDDGKKAEIIFKDIITNNPNSNYADASVYRIFSFYYSLGSYKQAEEYKQLLVDEYPSSPYIKLTNRKLPDEKDVVEVDRSAPTAQIQMSDEKNKYTIQAGAFMNINNAQNLKSKFIDDGLHSEISTKDIGGSIFNVVTVGKFSSPDAARGFLSTLKANYNIDGRVISNNQ